VEAEAKKQGFNFLSGGSATVVKHFDPGMDFKEEPFVNFQMFEESVASNGSPSSEDGSDNDSQTCWSSRETGSRKRLSSSPSTTVGQIKKRRGNVKNDYEGLSPADCDRLKQKRERNKQAAARCRQRREDMIKTLSDKVKKNQTEKESLLKEVADLRKQKSTLEDLLKHHQNNGCLQTTSVKLRRPLTLNVLPSSFPNVQTIRYPIDTPQSRINAFDNIPTGLTPNIENSSSLSEEFKFSLPNGRSMTIL